jgi:hypothetical chaperone protein
MRRSDPGAGVLAPGALGIDFGTSNSAVSFVGPDGVARLVPLEGEALALPTAVFFNAEDGRTRFGREAITQYLAGVEGRLMRSLKSLLGSSLLEEETAVGSGRLSFQAIIALFLRELRQRAAAHLRVAPTRAIIGRPVHFVDDDAGRDGRAQAALAQAAQDAGFEEVAFELEPIAAALDYERRCTRESLVLVVDIGGGTSDFTVVRVGPGRLGRPDRSDDILATTGVHIGGTDYDRRLNLERVMPLLGFRHVGPSGREVPAPTFLDLASWHLIHGMSAPKVLREVRQLRGDYRDAKLHERLLNVLEQHLGHRVANEVEQAKIRCSVEGGPVHVDLDFVERALAVGLTPQALATDLSALLERVVDCAAECVRRAGLQPEQLDGIYLTGGSSALQPFRARLQERFASVPLVEGDLFGGVASGLSYASRRGFS